MTVKRWIAELPDGTLHPAMILADDLRGAIAVLHAAEPGQRARIFEKSDPGTAWLVWGDGSATTTGGRSIP